MFSRSRRRRYLDLPSPGGYYYLWPLPSWSGVYQTEPPQLRPEVKRKGV
jgi:hypothetical protein